MAQGPDKRMSRRQFLKVAGMGVLAVGLPSLSLLGCAGCEWRSEPMLYDLINDYRKANGLSEIPISGSLLAVAAKHVLDLSTYHPETTSGSNCNLHSWSEHGDWQGIYGEGRWKGCCYAPDHSNASCMWDKPKEIANYSSSGYEIAAVGVSTLQDALNTWKMSTLHNDVILNKGMWTNHQWKALGAAISGGYACAWFGTTTN